MAQGSSSNPNNLPGIVTDQPEIYESEPALSDDTGVNDLDLNEGKDDAITLIEVPTRQAFAYFAERENEIAQFYVQRYGEYKLSSDDPEKETDIEKYHRLVSEVNQLLSKFQADRAARSEDDSASAATINLTNNLEILSRQLKALEFAAEDGSLNYTQAGYMEIKSKLDQLKDRVSKADDNSGSAEVAESRSNADDASRLIRMGALERRLNMMELMIGKNDDKIQNLFQASRCDNLVDATSTLGAWISLFQPDNLQRVRGEVDFLCQRLEKLQDKTAADGADGDLKQLDAQSKAKLEQLYNLVTTTDKQRAMVPAILHRLNALEALQKKAASVATTVNYLEQLQSQIIENLQSNKGELTSLSEMFSKNIEHIKQLSKDIDSRISALKDRDS